MTSIGAKPPIKWVGGKTQILDRILPLFPKIIKNYHEPFLGGGSVLLELLHQISQGNLRVTGRIYAYDINPHVIRLYQDIQHPDRCLALIVALDTLVNVHRQTPLTREQHYYQIRTQFNEHAGGDEVDCPDRVQMSAWFLFLNKTGFRGLYRTGPRGLNVPYGHYASPAVFDRAHLMYLSTLIHPVRFLCADFRNTLPLVDAGDFVYMDPPYVPVNTTTFVGYTDRGFPYNEELVALSHEMTQRGIGWIMSNSDVPWVRNQWESYTMHELVCKRAIHSTRPDATAAEVLVVSTLPPSES